MDTSQQQSWGVQTAGGVADTTAGDAEPGVANSSMDFSQNGGLRIHCEPVYPGNAEEASASMVETCTPYLAVEEPQSAASFGLGPSRRSGNLIAMGR